MTVVAIFKVEKFLCLGDKVFFFKKGHFEGS